MNAEEFKKNLIKNSKKDYGLCPPPLEAQDGLSILIEHFLGENWYTVMPLCQDQVNAEAVYTILLNYKKRKKIR